MFLLLVMTKKTLIILGGGFAGFSFLKRINQSLYNIIAVSPRNHFLFTPLLASTTVGTIEFRSIIEPIRNIKNIIYYQAFCISIDQEKQTILCCDTHSNQTFNLNYDILIIAAGEKTNTFDIPGVNENAYFLREISDSRKIRTRVIDCFEKASIPGITDNEKKINLS